MRCLKCRTESASGRKFCASCGSALATNLHRRPGKWQTPKVLRILRGHVTINRLRNKSEREL